MTELVLVILFSSGQVEMGTFGRDAFPARSFQDTAANIPAFQSALEAFTEEPDAKVCAVVPSYGFTSPLHKPLYDLLSQRIDDLPGIWQNHEGIRRIFRKDNTLPITYSYSEVFCKLVAKHEWNIQAY